MEEQKAEESNEEEKAIEQPPQKTELFYDLDWLAIQKYFMYKTPLGEYKTKLFNSFAEM